MKPVWCESCQRSRRLNSPHAFHGKRTKVSLARGAEEGWQQIEDHGKGAAGTRRALGRMQERPVVPHPLVTGHPVHHRAIIRSGSRGAAAAKRPDAGRVHGRRGGARSLVATCGSLVGGPCGGAFRSGGHAESHAVGEWEERGGGAAER
jgi:hypothetical protein